MSQIASDSLTSKAQAAFRVAMRKVLSRARQSGTGIVIWRDGRVVEISCDEAEQMLLAAERNAGS
jgi:hypothetical protein